MYRETLQWSDQRKSNLCSDARNVSDACGDDFCNQRNRYGTFYNRSTGAVQYADLHARKIIPDSVRMPAFIVVVASFVTIVQFLLEGFVPSLYDSLGLYIPLIVVNCIILGRAESYASKNPVLPSVFDGIGMGLGFTVGLTSIGIVRELIGSGKIFNFQVLPDTYEPITIFILAPGAFFVLAGLTALQNKIKNRAQKKGKPVNNNDGCAGGCASCAGCGSTGTNE